MPPKGVLDLLRHGGRLDVPHRLDILGGVWRQKIDREWVAFIAFAWPRWGRGSCVQICGGLVAVVVVRYCGSRPGLHCLPVGKIARG